jgi:hypothetical protein
MCVCVFFAEWSNQIPILQSCYHSKDSESLIYFICDIFFSPVNIIFWQLQIKILCIIITRPDDYSVTDMPGNDANMISLHKELENRQKQEWILS